MKASRCQRDAQSVEHTKGKGIEMGKAMIVDFPTHSKSVRYHMKEADSDLRGFYTACRLGAGSYNDEELMNAKLALWKKHGKYLDLAWRQHFALHVSWATGIGAWHGWHNSLRLHTYAKEWGAFVARCTIPF